MPYTVVTDSLDIWHGNPNLKPEHNTIMEFDYSFMNKYFFTFSYTISHDAIRYVAAQVGENKMTEFYPENIPLPQPTVDGQQSTDVLTVDSGLWTVNDSKF